MIPASENVAHQIGGGCVPFEFGDINGDLDGFINAYLTANATGNWATK